MDEIFHRRNEILSLFRLQNEQRLKDVRLRKVQNRFLKFKTPEISQQQSLIEPKKKIRLQLRKNAESGSSVGFSYLIDFNGHQIGDAVKSVKSPSPLSWTAVGLHVCPGVLQRGGKEKRRLRRAELIAGADGGADIQNGSLCYMTCETWSSYIIRFLRQTSHKLRAGGRTRRHLADHLFLFCLPQTLRFPQFSLDDHVRVNRNISGERL